MPRLPPSIFWRARRIAPGAALLLPVCRDLPSALTELRWIREHVEEKNSSRRQDWAGQQRILSLCRQRGRGEPLQPEPEAYSLHLVDLLVRESAQASKGTPQRLTILDACTGTGCIALLLYAELARRITAKGSSLHVVGIDLAPEAVSLARTNADRNGLKEDDPSRSIRFMQCDLFADDWLHHPDMQNLVQSPLDVLVSNPPYISVQGFAHDTARSVRLFEPKLAQVPRPRSQSERLRGGQPEDVFYVRLLALAARLDARLVLCEVSGLTQAERVVALALATEPHIGVEIWADEPDIVGVDEPGRTVSVAGRDVPIKGSGHGRSVFIRRR